MTSLDKIKEALEEEAKKIKAEQEGDVVKRTVANSIKIEKGKLFGMTAGGKKQIDELINKSLKEYKEKKNAS